MYNTIQYTLNNTHEIKQKCCLVVCAFLRLCYINILHTYIHHIYVYIYLKTIYSGSGGKGGWGPILIFFAMMEPQKGGGGASHSSPPTIVQMTM